MTKARLSKTAKTFLELADPSDAYEIAAIFSEEYAGTYPYKQMTDPNELKKLIESDNHIWLLIKTDPGEIAGCYAAELMLPNKKGLHYGFLIRKDYREKVDIYKAWFGSMLYFWKTYKDKVLVWFGEVRSYHATVQLGTILCGLKPIGFFPNKDIFFNAVESDILAINYDKQVINELRLNETPSIIRPILKSYQYAQKRYKLQLPKIINPNINFGRFNNQQNNASKVKIEVDSLGNKIIEIILNKKTSLTCKFNPFVRSIEKVCFNIQNHKEFYILLKRLEIEMNRLKSRYIECFVSAYNPYNQAVLYELGYRPGGYIPCWKFNQKYELFEDYVLFTKFTGELSKKIELLPETKRLLKAINLLDKIPHKNTNKAIIQQDLEIKNATS